MIIKREPWFKYAYFAALGLIAALGNMGVVYTINRVINDYFSNRTGFSNIYLLYFLGSLIIFIICRWLVSFGIIRFTQRLLRHVRKEVMSMALRLSFGNLVRNKDRIFSALTRDTDNIVNASINIVDILTNAIVVVICFVYMGMLSWQLLLCMLGLMVFTLLIYFLGVRRAESLFKLAMEQNDRFVRYLNEILQGYKEIYIAPRKGRDILQKHVHPSIDTASEYNKKAQVTFLNNRIIGQTAFYLFIGLIMLFLGRDFHVEKGVLVNFIFLILYVWGPIETVVLLAPALSQANASIKRVKNLEDQIVEEGPVDEGEAISSFYRISAKNIRYAYPKEQEDSRERSFGIGPIEFQIEKGEAVFISGGNGSGKTTFINILLGLIRPDEGSIFVDDALVAFTGAGGYKSLFAPVCSDVHLFDEFYGMGDVDLGKANAYLKFFEIDDKVNVDAGKFSDLNVSTGQRKRLALIGAMLEKRPILVLDEFAADQDPHFKRKFYEEIIPFIKSEGFTLIAITHDDNYYHYADRLLKMDAGRLYETRLKPVQVIDMVS